MSDASDGFRMGLDAASELVANGIDPRHDAERTAATELDEHGHISRATAEALLQVIHGLRTIIATHDLCHNLHGKVGPREFADGCADEQRKLFGCAPDADKVHELLSVLMDVNEREANRRLNDAPGD